ncbi:MAG: lytic murein transglycosylase B [Gammaproteobacteria bacterium]|nr:lytic murein transglycosylase B [Gammaproteobacteria bacterium]MBU1969868.1 lytic murein transglycosylase B [Gammaproteobacteria bacterium]
MKKRISLFLLSFHLSAQAADLPGIPPFIDAMVDKHQFRRDELQRAFQLAERRQDVIDSISMPATLRPWVEYRPNFINPQRISLGVRFWKKHERALRRAEKIYGVPQEIIVGIIGVETMYGNGTGHYRALDALTTLAFDFPRRADFFRDELEKYLLLAREQGFDLLSIQSSYAGALGIPQFMPSNYRRYAVDFNGNGKVDIMREPEDAIGSVANYLKHYGWRSGEPVALLANVEDAGRMGSIGDSRPYLAWKEAGVTTAERQTGILPPAWVLDFTVKSGKEYWLVFNNFNVIMRYNISNFYAMSVHQLAEAVRQRAVQ